jgi:hypothetical protein
MLSMPFTIFGLFAGSMYLAVRRARKLQPPSESFTPDYTVG